MTHVIDRETTRLHHRFGGSDSVAELWANVYDKDTEVKFRNGLTQILRSGNDGYVICGSIKNGTAQYPWISKRAFRLKSEARAAFAELHDAVTSTDDFYLETENFRPTHYWSFPVDRRFVWSDAKKTVASMKRTKEYYAIFQKYDRFDRSVFFIMGTALIFQQNDLLAVSAASLHHGESPKFAEYVRRFKLAFGIGGNSEYQYSKGIKLEDWNVKRLSPFLRNSGSLDIFREDTLEVVYWEGGKRIAFYDKDTGRCLTSFDAPDYAESDGWAYESTILAQCDAWYDALVNHTAEWVAVTARKEYTAFMQSIIYGEGMFRDS